MEKKVCRVCGKLKGIDNFYKIKKMKDGYRNECKDCCKILYFDRLKKKNKNKLIKDDGEKICRICKKNKFIKDFHVKRWTFDGRRSECKECIKIIQKKYKESPEYQEKRKDYDKQRYEKKKHQILDRKKEYYIENKKDILEYKKNYRTNNSEKIKNWRINNKERLSELQSNYRKRYPHIVAWRSILHSTIKRLGTKKQDKTINLLGYSVNDLKEHIEKRFKKGMTWENYGDWEIDHIRPVSSFSSDDLISVVNSLDNLQPLWKIDNLIKGSNVI